MRYRPFLYVSVLAGVAYLVTQRWQPFPGNAFLKGCAAGALCLLAVQMRALRHDSVLLAIALAFSAAGDVMLDIDPAYFPLGLGAFLLTHLTYIVLFVRNRARPLQPGTPRSAAVLAVVGLSIAVSAWIVPSAGALGVPVVLYICAITAMVSMSILARLNAWVTTGAVLFLVSDSLLAINKFKAPVPFHEYLVWSTYYLGQCGIALGFLSRAEKAAARSAGI